MLVLSHVIAQVGEVVPLDTPDVQWSALLPLIVLAGGAVLMLTIASLVPSFGQPGVPAVTTVVIALASIVAAVPVWERVQDPDRGPLTAVGGALGIDGFSVFLTVLIAVAVILAALLLDDYLRREGIDAVEWYVLVLLSAVGGVIMASANDLIVLFLGYEALSIAVYVLAAMHRKRVESQEAGFKYFIVGAFSSAILLYGIAMIYGATGSTNLVDIADFLAADVLLENGLLMIGMAMILVGFAFKVSAVPFHSWTPDVYQGAPTPVTAFMASAVKVGAFAGLLRVFYLGFGQYAVDWQPIVYALAVLTMVVGSMLAVVQSDVKRMLAYSSISHAGFLLVGVQAATQQGVEATLFYLATYVFVVAGSFGVITLVSGRGDAATSIDDLRGLSQRRPGLALAFTLFLLAQAGVPLTSGFFAKFYVIEAAIEARSFWLALVAMLASVIAAALYLRVIVAMYLTDVDEAELGPRVRIPVTAGIALTASVVVTLGIGVLPGVLTEVVADAIPALVALP
ncbi:MAG TPA: NADH-quinone oxidoreductase subunit N [Acidimicrobiales bacterium]|nr:NADH-quinone oxidoreductase subunit N [Acidimicrobiales bacterium]